MTDSPEPIPAQPDPGETPWPAGAREAVPADTEVVDVADVADNVRKKLAPEHIQVETIASWITAAVIFVTAGGVLLIGTILGWFSVFLFWILVVAFVALAGLLVWLALRWPRTEYRYTSYLVNQSGIDIWTGIVWRKVVSVPRSRVQHTDVAQGPLQRKYGIATLVIHTAGTEEAKVELKGLAHGTALSIRDYLIQAGEDDAV